jgi:hypothetical protein
MAVPRFPIAVLERETGDLYVLPTLQSVVAFVEEFRDILAADFRLWDVAGRTVIEVESVLNGAPLRVGEHDPAFGESVRARLARADMPAADAEAMRALLEA